MKEITANERAGKVILFPQIISLGIFTKHTT